MPRSGSETKTTYSAMSKKPSTTDNQTLLSSDLQKRIGTKYRFQKKGVASDATGVSNQGAKLAAAKKAMADRPKEKPAAPAPVVGGAAGQANMIRQKSPLYSTMSRGR